MAEANKTRKKEYQARVDVASAKGDTNNTLAYKVLTEDLKNKSDIEGNT